MNSSTLKTVQPTVLLCSRDQLFVRQLEQEVARYAPDCDLIPVNDCDTFRQLHSRLQVNVLLFDGRSSSDCWQELQDHLLSCQTLGKSTVLAVVDHHVSRQQQERMLTCGVDDFICAEDPLHVALRLRGLSRLNQMQQQVAEYEQQLSGQFSELRLLQMAVDNSEVMISTLDRELRVQMANESFRRFCLLKRGQVPGVPLAELVDLKQYRSQIKPAVERALAGEDVCLQALQARRHPQQPYVQLYCYPLRDGLDEIQGVALILNDITELKEMEQRYSEISREFQTLLDGISDAITLLRPDRTVAWGNRAAAEMLNTSEQGLPEQFCCVSAAGHIVSPEQPYCASCAAVECLSKGKLISRLLSTPDGRSLGVKVFPLRADDGTVTGVIRMVSDVTEAVQLRTEADQNSRLAALGELAAGVAHEINNPNGLLAINNGLLEEICSAMLEALQQQGTTAHFGGFSVADLAQELPQLFKNNRAASLNIRRIVEDLKLFTRADQKQFERIDLNEVILAAQRMTGNSLKKATDHFTVDYADNLPCVYGSFQGLEQVVINLLMNACQALPDPSRAISVQTTLDDSCQRVQLWVRDTGVGISEQDLGKIFDPFFTTKREEGGTGLGLSVSSRIIREHGGFLNYESQLGQGTRVCVSLPAGESV